MELKLLVFEVSHLLIRYCETESHLCCLKSSHPVLWKRVVILSDFVASVLDLDSHRVGIFEVLREPETSDFPFGFLVVVVDLVLSLLAKLHPLFLFLLRCRLFAYLESWEQEHRLLPSPLVPLVPCLNLKLS